MKRLRENSFPRSFLAFGMAKDETIYDEKKKEQKKHFLFCDWAVPHSELQHIPQKGVNMVGR